jgi:hypothetical protein
VSSCRIRRAFRIDEAVLGTDHPTVATILSNLGLVLQDLREFGAAKAHLPRAFEIDRKVLREDHPSTKRVRENLAALDEN